jgi:CARDB
MNRSLITAAAMAVVATVTVTPAAATTSHAVLRGFGCQHAFDPPGRGVSVTAVMRPITGTLRLQVRFELLMKAKSARRFTAISGRDLGNWLSPAISTLGQRPGDVWILRKPVVDLVAPAAYRFRVHFRWLGAHSRVLATATRQTGTCQQLELRPDLVVQSIAVQSVLDKPKLNRYVARIVNRGASAAGPFEVLIAPAGRTKSVAGLGSHSSTLVSFTGPACATTSPPTIEADPYDQVDDYDRLNNQLTAVCTPLLAP